MTYHWTLSKNIAGRVPLVQQELCILSGRYLMVFVLVNHQFYAWSIYLFIVLATHNLSSIVLTDRYTLHNNYIIATSPKQKKYSDSQ
jgi:hypothetical protein